MGLGERKPVFGGLPTTKAQTSLPGSVQACADPHRLISAFVIRFLQSNISKLATDEISIF